MKTKNTIKTFERTYPVPLEKLVSFVMSNYPRQDIYRVEIAPTAEVLDEADEMPFRYEHFGGHLHRHDLDMTNPDDGEKGHYVQEPTDNLIMQFYAYNLDRVGRITLSREAVNVTKMLCEPLSLVTTQEAERALRHGVGPTPPELYGLYWPSSGMDNPSSELVERQKGRMQSRRPRFWADFLAELVERINSNPFLQQQEAQPVRQVKHAESRGMNIGTEERVKKMHGLLKTGDCSLHKAETYSHCDTDTYRKRCKEVTGEDPITPINTRRKFG